MTDMSQGLLRIRRDIEGTDWRNYAACRDVDPDLFFPLGTSGASLLQIDEAKQICRTCPVCGPCLRWALESGAAGVWGRHRGGRAAQAQAARAASQATNRIQADFLNGLRTDPPFHYLLAPAR